MDYYITDIKKIKSYLLSNIADTNCVGIKDKIEKLIHQIIGTGSLNYGKPLIIYFLIGAILPHLFQDTINFIL